MQTTPDGSCHPGSEVKAGPNINHALARAGEGGVLGSQHPPEPHGERKMNASTRQLVRDLIRRGEERDARSRKRQASQLSKVRVELISPPEAEEEYDGLPDDRSPVGFV